MLETMLQKEKNIENCTEQLYNKNFKEPNWEFQFEKLKSWAEKSLNLKIHYKDDQYDSADIEKEKIIVYTKHTPEIGFYYFLHELGHVYLAKNKKSYKHTYDNVYENFSANSLTYRIITLQEELEAWRTGLKIAKSLRLSVNRKKYEIEKSKCVATYLAWAIKQSAHYKNQSVVQSQEAE